MRVVDRVHDGTADGRADALPAVAAGLADLDVAVLGVADLAHGGAAGQQHAAHLGRRHAEDGVLALLAHQLDAGAGGTCQSGALAGLQLDGVNQGADGDVGQRQSVAGLDVGFGARDDHVAHLEALRMQDVALLAIQVVQQRDARRAVGVVLDSRNLGGHAVLVALEIDDTVTALVATALMARGDAAVVVAARMLLQRRNKRLLGLAPGDFRKVGNHHEAASGRGRLILLDSHLLPSSFFREDPPLFATSPSVL